MTNIERFLQHKAYLQNVSPATLSWYTSALHKLPSEQPTQEQLNDLVISLRQSGLKETGVNACTRALNCYLHWNSGHAGKCSPGCVHPHVVPMKEPSFVPPSFTAPQVQSILRFKPESFYQKRTQLCLLIMLDTGARISEVLGLQVRSIDFDNLLLTLMGKGRKERIVPMSVELRRRLYAYTVHKQAHDFVLSSPDGAPVNRVSQLRLAKSLCILLGFTPPARTLHACRTTMASAYVRAGGDVFRLQKMLGHSSLEMSRRYANLNTDDLSAVHQRLSLLS
ncbi:MAG: tyrosine-type recombinase/integrase [Terriglobales bacterium]